MRRFICIIVSLFMLTNITFAQSVGLVLSGGGAKGITHIGIIQALEDNNIPIDYVAGTSIGAIIGGLYAMGYTPLEMLDLIGSKEFQQCYTGEVDEGNLYYIKQNDPTPSLYTIKANLGDSIADVQALPLSLIDPVHMNITILELCIQATAACGGDFDKLFVPFRCVASDVYKKEEIVFSHGDLGNAVRASMTFPLVFRPIKINGTLAYDGGIYNNFPADVMKRDFAPDYIIGSVVSSNNEQPSEDNIIEQVETMIMQASNYTLPDENGILLDFELQDVGLLDFDKAQYLFDLGYATTLQYIDSIKSRVPRTYPTDSLRARRKAYKETLPEVVFKSFSVSGVTEAQRRYVVNEIRPSGHRYVRMGDFREAYFRLISENVVNEIQPTATYNPKDKTFNLHLNVSMKDNVSLSFGGGLSTNNINQLYFGLDYNHLRRHSTELQLDGQFGRMYNNIQFMGRFNFAKEMPMSLRLLGSHSNINYFKQSFLFSENLSPALNRQTETFTKLKLALPFMTQHKAEFGIGIGQITDNYLLGSTIDLSNIDYTSNRYRLLGGSVLFKRNSLNSIQYATKGVSQQILAQIFTGTNCYIPTKITPKEIVDTEDISWMQFSFRDQRYLPMNNKFILGTHIEGHYSSRNLAQNYTATMMQAGSFSPTPSMLFTYNPAFRANQYVAAGLKPIYTFKPFLQLRFEAYVFVPIVPILQNEEGKAHYGAPLSTFSHLEELSIVGRFSTFVISAYLNHNSSTPKNINAGISLGWYMFNNRFIEQ